MNVSDWVKENQGQYFCQCGCGKVITIIKIHHSRGIPKYIKGHCSRINNSMKGRFGELNPNFKSGKYINHQGYIVVLVPAKERNKKENKYIFEHRLVIEKCIGKKIKSTEQVHHINGVKTDNRLENLELLGIGEHASKHQQELRKSIGEVKYMEAKRLINKGLPYKHIING